MAMSMAANHAAKKQLNDAIFGASAAAKAAAKEHGAAAITNATIGSMMGDDGKIVCLPTMERVFRSLPMEDIVSYAPITGVPAYLDAVIDLTFADQKPDGYMASIATAGGTGAIHDAVANYMEKGEKALTSDWYWGTYAVICREAGGDLETYTLFDEKGRFHLSALTAKAAELLAVQESLLLIINTPAHNPTGYSLSEEDWDGVIAFCKDYAAKGKRISLLVDIAYIDFAGEKNETRKFMKKFAHLPANILVMFAFSMSKGYTLYGQRTGALIALSSSEDVIEEFKRVTKYSSRATWSNINHGAMELLVRIQQDKAVLAQFEKERDDCYQMIRQRGAIFMQEAAQCGLQAVPYKAGFFLSVPSSDPQAVCNALHKELVFAVPLKLGVRIAACSVPTEKMKGLASKVKAALDSVK